MPLPDPFQAEKDVQSEAGAPFGFFKRPKHLGRVVGVSPVIRSHGIPPLLLAKDQLDRQTVLQNVCGVVADLFEGIDQDGQAVERQVRVDGFRPVICN